MISVVLPAYNRRNTVRKAVESVLNQTERDIECIVVDDASTDDTAGVLTEISDSRLRIIRLTENSGACHARNVGVQAAKGEYIAFQDSDDCFHPDKLERQWAFLRETGADVVFCGMNRICGQQMEAFPTYVPDKCITRIDLLEANLASTQCIFGKAEAFRNTPFDEDMPRLQDWALMLELAKKYIVRGEATPLVDVYVQPDSLSNQPKKLFPALRRIYLRYAETINAICPEHWTIILTQAAERIGEEAWQGELLENAPECVVRPEQIASMGNIVLGQGDENPQGKILLTRNLSDMQEVRDRCYYLPRNLLGKALKESLSVEIAGRTAVHPLQRLSAMLCGWLNHQEAWETVTRVYAEEEIIETLAADQLMEMPLWARVIRQAGRKKLPDKPIRRVAAYYHNVHGGGVQQVTAKLLHVWRKMGLEVTLITSQQPNEEDFPLPKEVRRVVIPPFDPFDWESRSAHVRRLAEVAREVDLVVDHAWADPMVLFDVLAIQSAGAKVLLHTHSVFSMTLLKRELHDRFQCLPDVAAMADGVVALTPADACYWRQFSPRVFETRNPIEVEGVPLNALGGRTMLWVGRNSPEKRPMDAIKAVMWIGDRVPGAKLIIMGGGFEHEAEMNWLKNVEYVGYHQDTEEIFRQADVFLCTSEYEGFSLTMAEAQAHGIPCVTYDMPYLPILQGGGHVAVPMGDADALAKAAADLLLDASRRVALGQEARKNVEHLCIDQTAKWTEIFAQMAEAKGNAHPDAAVQQMVSTLSEHALRQEKEVVFHEIEKPEFIPMPKHGPFKLLRKKLATACKLLLVGK